MSLHNKKSSTELKKSLEKNKFPRIVLSFYRYFEIKNVELFRDYLFINLKKLNVFGRIYVAKEGINAQISVPKKKYGELSLFLSKISFLKEIKLNLAIEHNYKSFFKLIVKVKNKIVADGIKIQDFKPHDSGKHVNAKQFNELLSCSNTICIDVRNHYESEIGHFIGALTPDVDTFSDSLPIIENQLSKFNKDKNILMYCTGGIRCEKASAYIKHKGYKNVYQLSGGIIQYAREVKEMKIKNFFKGKNFVFDDRRSEKVTEEVISKCHQCGKKSDHHVNCFNNACNLLFIQCKNCQKKMKNCCSKECIDITSLSIEEQKKLRKGNPSKNKIFKKGRAYNLKFYKN